MQYTFTHKQYTGRHKTNNTKNNTKIEYRTTQKWERFFAELCNLVPRLGVCFT
jgi:hypothetical protein